MPDALAFTRLLGTPLILAPMAGGISNSRAPAGGLARWCSRVLAGGGYQTPEQLADKLTALKRAGSSSFGVNLFVPAAASGRHPEAVAAYARALEPQARRLGVELGSAVRVDDWFTDKVAVLTADPVAAVSFTFGLPPEAGMAALRAVGSVLIATVTNPAEARAATQAGMDALCVQAAVAGGHRGTFGNYPGSTLPLAELLAAVREVSPLPMIAAGASRRPLS